MDKAELLALAERCEAVTAEMQGKLIEEAWTMIHHEGYPPEGDWDTCKKCDFFYHILDARAYESAALMLVPEGASFQLHVHPDLIRGMWCGIFPDPEGEDRFSSSAATPALALTAASLRAAVAMMETDDGR